MLSTRLARRGIPPVRLFATGIALSIVMLALITLEALPATHALWIAYGVCAGFGTLGYSLTAAGFPLALAGRATTTYNLMVFAGGFGAQWGMGLLIDLLTSMETARPARCVSSSRRCSCCRAQHSGGSSAAGVNAARQPANLRSVPSGAGPLRRGSQGRQS